MKKLNTLLAVWRSLLPALSGLILGLGVGRLLTTRDYLLGWGLVALGLALTACWAVRMIRNAVRERREYRELIDHWIEEAAKLRKDED